MTTTLDVDPTHASQALQQAGYAEGERVRLTVERIAPRRSGKEIAERVRQDAPLTGLSEMVIQSSKEVRARFSLDPYRKTSGTTD